jgi:hypothetical protein
MGFICHRFLAVVVQTWVWSKDALFGFSVPYREKLYREVPLYEILFFCFVYNKMDSRIPAHSGGKKASFFLQKLA